MDAKERAAMAAKWAAKPGVTMAAARARGTLFEVYRVTGEGDELYTGCFPAAETPREAVDMALFNRFFEPGTTVRVYRCLPEGKIGAEVVEVAEELIA